MASPSTHPPSSLSPSFGSLGSLSPLTDASDDDADHLHTPLTEHDQHHHHLPYGAYNNNHHFSPHMFHPYTPNLDSLPGGAKPQLIPQALSPLPSLSPLLAPSPSESLTLPHQDTFFSSFSSPPHALDLANASLEISHFTPSYASHTLDPAASPFTPTRVLLPYDTAASTSSDHPAATHLSPLSALSMEGLGNGHPDDAPSLLLSPADQHNHARNLHPMDDIETRGRMYNPRFPAEHTLNPFFVRAYQLGDELGAGGYGFVMTAIHRAGGNEVAVKFIIKEKVPEHAWWQDEMYGKIPTEVMILSLVDHENIVKCLDLFEDNVYFYLIQELHGSPWVSKRKKKDKQITAPGKLIVPSVSSTPSLTPSPSVESTADSVPHTPPQVCIEEVDTCDPSAAAGQDLPPINAQNSFPEVLSANAKGSQLMLQPPPVPQLRPNFSRRPSHDLFECIEQSKHKRLSENQARYIFAQVVEAVYYLESQGITHCDIKDENLVIDHDLKVKLIDFGSAVVVDPSAPRPYYTLFFGTTAYAASEILLKQPYRAPPAEIWTLGVLLSYLLTGHSPFPTEQDAIDGRVVLRESSKAGAGRLSRAAITLIGRCLEKDPERRADVTEVRGHRWLQGALERGAHE